MRTVQPRAFRIRSGVSILHSVRRGTCLLATLLLFVSACLGAPLPDEFARQLWRVQDGLPEDIVQAAVQDQSGFLWVGTTGGLARFDGSEFEVFDSTSSPRLPVNSVFCLLSGRDGSLWIGSEGGGLLRLRNGVLTRFGAGEGLSDPFVRALLEDSRGALWVGTDNGLFLLGPHAGRLIRKDTGPAVAPLAVHAIAEDRHRLVWVGGSRLVTFDENGRTTPQEHLLPGRYSQNRVKTILPAQDGTIWVGTVGGLVRLEGGSFHPVGPVDGTVRALHQAADGAIWIGTIGHGMWRSTAGKLEKLDAEDLLPSTSVLAISEDRSGQMWISTQGGLVRLSRTPVHVVPLPHAADPDFATISKDRDGAIWAVASKVFRIKDGRARAEPLKELGSPSVRNLLRTRDGSLWVGTDGDGAFWTHDGLTRHFHTPELTSNFVRAFLETRSGDIWIAGDEGLNRFSHGRVERYGMSEGLAYFSTRCLLESADGDVWIGTEQGLSHWRQGRFVIDELTQALAHEKVWALAQDPGGVLWIGTRDHGLFRARGTQVLPFTRAQGLPTDSIYGIADSAGRLWFSGPNTLFSAALQDLDRSDGSAEHPLQVTSYALPFRAGDAQFYGGRQPSVCIDGQGRLWFPSSRGAVYLEPGEIPFEAPSAVFLRSVLVDGQPVGDLAQGVQIGANSRRLVVNYAPLLLGAQNGVSYRYKLENFDKTWTYAGPARTASYTNLPAGHYTFRVESLGGARAAAATVAIDKVPFFWETWWFAALALVTALGAGWTMYRLHLARIRERFDAVLVERTRLAREMHDTVIQGCTSISALLEAIASRRAAPARAGQRQASEPADELLDHARMQIRTTVNEAREAVWNLRHKVEPERRLPDILEAAAAQARRESSVPIRLLCDGDTVLLGSEQAHELSMIVREALSNAVLHGRPREIEVRAQAESATMRLRIADDGTGFVPQEQPQHFGITGMRERAARLGGRLEVRSTPGRGTVVDMLVERAGLRQRGEREGR